MAGNSRAPVPPQPPLSFKTVPGRHRTQKWTKAPTYSYEGDDWGGYDPYDEYGDREEPLPPPPPPPVPAQGPLAAQQNKARGRVNSFDRGDESGQFAAPVAPVSASTFPAYEDPTLHMGQPNSATSGGRRSNDSPRSRSRPRDFTRPDQVPPPLNTNAAPTPQEWFPPRKSSLSGNTYETAAAAAEAKAIAEAVSAPVTADTNKQLPFIRPSDIYKRIPEELRRQSEEGGRPSPDALQRDASPSYSALAPVAEARESRLFMGDEVAGVGEHASRGGATSPSTRGGLPVLQTSNIVNQAAHAKELPPIRGSPNPGAPAGMQTTGDPDAAPRIASPVLSTPSNYSSQPTSGSLQNTPIFPTLPPGQDLATEVLVGRQNAAPINSSPRAHATELQHQPSQGFRSAVHHAFDRSDNLASLSRDGSLSTNAGSGVSRSDTRSTAGISPIMSGLPPTANPQIPQQYVEGQVPPIAEETNITPTGSRPGSGLARQIVRKPSPGSTRVASGGEPKTMAEFEPGYRRSFEPPSSGASPARTPGVASTGHRLSTPLAAVPVSDSDPSDVPDQGAEVPQPALTSAEISANGSDNVQESGPPVTFKPLPHTGRSRSGTDYSVREADIADTVNSAPEQAIDPPSIAEAQKSNQRLFLETHGTPSSPTGPAFRGNGTPTNGSRSGSPAKGRVREIADKYSEIHQASRRDSTASISSSKSSWSQFGDVPKLKQQGPSHTQLASDGAVTGGRATTPPPLRPDMGRVESFNPVLPGGWISAVPTPSVDSHHGESMSSDPLASDSSETAPRNLQIAENNEQIDLTPTTRKYSLQEVPGSDARSPTAFDSLKDAGNQLGAALLSNMGIGHQTRDFGSTEPAVPVDQPETHFKSAAGAVPLPAPLIRQETGSTNAATSVASSAVPTPLAKDTPLLNTDGGNGYFNTVAPLRVRSRETSPEHMQPPTAYPLLTRNSGTSEIDSDRLGEEIVRSLDPAKHEVANDDVPVPQNAFAATSSEHRPQQGGLSLPTVESGSGFLTTRFSWEDNTGHLSSFKAPEATPQPQPEPASPEIKPEAAYERPRSSILHVVNTEIDIDSPEEERVPPFRDPQSSVNPPTDSLLVSAAGAAAAASAVSPITKSQEHLLPSSDVQPGSPSQSLRDMAPSPISDTAPSSRLPSYYLGNHDLEVPDAPEKDHTTASSMSHLTAPDIATAAVPTATVPTATIPTATVPTATVPSSTILPFRQILAMKTCDERIKTYNDTRQTFAGMNTGLDNWLSMMIEQHPEHVDSSGANPPLLHTTSSGLNTLKRGHKTSPSIAKFTNKFASGDGQRSASIGGASNAVAAEESSSPRPAVPGADGPRLDVDKMKQRGNEFMKSAGVFGGKASAGAKGLFAKSKSRFGSGNVKRSGNEVP